MRSKQTALLFILLLWLLAACNPTEAVPTAAIEQPIIPATATPATVPTEQATGSAPPKTPSFLLRPAPDLLRVMSFNPYWDAIFPAGDPLNNSLYQYDRAAAFRRIVQAVAPDVLCLQEVNPAREPAQVSQILDEVLPLSGGQTWQASSGQDNVIASRYPLSLEQEWEAYPGDFVPGHATALVDLPGAGPDLYIVCAHFKSAGGDINVLRRQQQADGIIALLRDARTPGGEVDLPEGTPLLVMGDFNVYDTDPAYHLTTMLTGDVVDEETYGPDSPPDWDSTALADVLPVHNATGTARWTWRDDTQEFNPGILDHILYSDSVLTLEHAFVLNTMSLESDLLQAAGLEAADVTLDAEQGLYDHLPLVADFAVHE